MSRGRAVMVQGCSSSAGKSLVATALCRWYADRGLRVTPFKAQNMSNHARLATGVDGGPGGEIGVAQWLQAVAARVPPDVRMNPVLVKPERDGSQVVRLGRVDRDVTALPWGQRAPRLWPTVAESLDALLDTHDLVVCEGAGSPAETNLRASDLANMPVARHADAPVLLVADIDRGGALAHLVGTWDLVDPDDRPRLAAFVLNKFRGDVALLGDGPATVTARTGMACAGVLPMLDHDLPDEDSSPPPGRVGPPSSDAPVVAIVRYPSASNLDEFAALDRAATVVRARRAGDLAGADLVILPGSKDVGPDLDWVRRTGLAEAVTSCAAAGGRVLGICGGLHMLGRRIEDPVGIEGGRGPWCRDGLGLLPVATRYAATKTVSTWTARFGDLGGPWRALAARPVGGYDVRLGDTTGPATAAALPDGRAWVSGAVLGVAGHGLLEDGDLLGALLGVPAVSACELWEASIDDLAGAVDRHLDTDLLARLTGGLL